MFKIKVTIIIIIIIINLNEDLIKSLNAIPNSFL